jgi:hypothetical protein
MSCRTTSDRQHRRTSTATARTPRRSRCHSLVSVQVKPRVFRLAEQRWREDGPKWAIDLVVVGARGERVEVSPVQASLVESQSAFEAAQGEDDEPFFGEWGCRAVGDRVLIAITKADDFRMLMDGLVAGLERRSVSGTIDLWREPPPRRVPHHAPMLTCHLRVRGDRMRVEPGVYRWVPDASALTEVVLACDRWCHEAGEVVQRALRTGGTGMTVRSDNGDDDVLAEAVASQRIVEAPVWYANGFRSLYAHGVGGGVAVVAGGEGPTLAWRREAEALVGLLESLAGLLVYGYVRRGWHVDGAHQDSRVGADWPERDHREQTWLLGPAVAYFEDLYAPDVFGAQLLGPGYEGRVPDHPSWQTRRTGAGSWLVTHRDPGAWFADAFVPFGQHVHPRDRPQPDVLVRSREELAPILYTPGVLVGGQFPDLERDATIDTPH